MPFEDCVKPECIASLHGFDLSRVMFLAGRTSPIEIIVIGVEPARIDWGTELSPGIQEMIPAVIEAIKAAIADKKPALLNAESRDGTVSNCFQG